MRAGRAAPAAVVARPDPFCFHRSDGRARGGDRCGARAGAAAGPASRPGRPAGLARRPRVGQPAVAARGRPRRAAALGHHRRGRAAAQGEHVAPPAGAAAPPAGPGAAAPRRTIPAVPAAVAHHDLGAGDTGRRRSRIDPVRSRSARRLPHGPAPAGARRRAPRAGPPSGRAGRHRGGGDRLARCSDRGGPDPRSRPHPGDLGRRGRRAPLGRPAGVAARRPAPGERPDRRRRPRRRRRLRRPVRGRPRPRPRRGLDPALPDLAAIDRFRKASGPAADEAAWRRAHGWAIWRALGGLFVAEAGRRGEPGGKVTWGPPAVASLHRLLEDAAR